MPACNRKPLSLALLFVVLVLALLAALLWWLTTAPHRVTPAAIYEPAPAQEELSIDLNLQPALVEWFNQVAQPGDMARADQLSQIRSLDEVTFARKVVVFRSAALAEQLVPRMADKLHVLGYNLEHGPLTPLDEQADPVGSIQRLRALADRYGMKLALGPDHDFALSHGVALAPYVDIFVLQVQRVQTEPEVVREFVVPLVEQVRQANPQINTSMQVRSEGDVDALAELIGTLRGSLDGISILTSPDTTKTAQVLVTALRPALSEIQAAAPSASLAQSEQESSETNSSWFVLGVLLVIGIGTSALASIVLLTLAVMVWRTAKAQ